MNKTLLTGLLLTGIMILIAFFGPFFAPHELDHQIKIEYFIDETGDGYFLAPPAPPGGDYPLGTDRAGYDLMTKLLHGAKYTIFLSIGIAIARVFVGGLIGMLLGYFSKVNTSQKKGASYWTALNGIPIFLIVWLVMIGVSMNPKASTFEMSILLAVVLLIVGVPSVASTVKDKTMVIRERQFVMASESLGASGWKIIRSHLFPQMKESFLILIVQEVILTLTLFGQLALFNIFVGGTTVLPDPTEYHSRSNEWAGLIAKGRMNFYVYQWIFYIPLAAYASLIIGFHLISKGLEKRYGKLFAKFSHL